MKYVTVVAENYDDAVQKARVEYGNNIRIHSRRSMTVPGGFLWLGKKNRVEITCYLPDAGPAFPWQDEESVRLETSLEKPIEPEQLSESSQAIIGESAPDETVIETLEADIPFVNPVEEKETEADKQIRESSLQTERARNILELNGFSTWFIQKVMASIAQELEGSTIEAAEEFELMLIDKIVSMIDIDRQMQLHPPRVCVIMGPTGTGKTTTIAKMAAIYGLQQRKEFKRTVRLITIDSFRIGAFEQIAYFGQALGMSVQKVTGEDEFSALLEQSSPDDLLLVDTIGRSPRDNELGLRMKSLLSIPDKEETAVILALGAMMKSRDVYRTIEAYRQFGIRSVIVTKTDETDSIGEVLSACAELQLPILFFTDGQHVPKDIHKASAASILSLLKGFSLDFANLWNNQIDIDQNQSDTVSESDENNLP